MIWVLALGLIGGFAHELLNGNSHVNRWTRGQILEMMILEWSVLIVDRHRMGLKKCSLHLEKPGWMNSRRMNLSQKNESKEIPVNCSLSEVIANGQTERRKK
jgi:hypothetical protein